MLTLRLYQQEAIDATYQHLRMRDDNPCIVLPAGSGKSVVLGKITTDAVVRWSGRVLILAHVKELLEQNADKIARLCPDIDLGIYSAGLGMRDTNNSAIVAGIQSVFRKAGKLGKFDLIIIDECHLIPTSGEGMYRKFLADMKLINPKVRVIGLTATPYRLDGGLICKPGNILNHVCYEVNISDMIDAGYLSKLRTKAGKTKADLSDLHVRAGEYIASEIANAMDKNNLVQSACLEIVSLTKDRKKFLIFAASVSHCMHIADEITRLSKQECAIVTGDTPRDKRAEILARFRGQKVQADLFSKKPPIKFLVNVNVLTTGFDAPETDCVVLLRPTASTGLYVQILGRGTRLYPGKDDCLILDYGGNVLRHGPVDAVKVRESESSITRPQLKECPKCGEILSANIKFCSDCGWEFIDEIFETEEPKLADSASTEAVLTSEIEDLDYQVRSTNYMIWEKRDRETNEIISRTMRIDYSTGLGISKSEWVCPEHDGWARKKFEAWWSRRCKMPAPMSTEEAVEIAQSGGLAEPASITVRRVSSQRFDKIIDYDLSDIPPGLDGADEYQTQPEYAWAGDDIPF